MTDWTKRMADLRKTYEDNPRPKDTSDWVNLIMSKPSKEERRQVLDQVPNAIRAHVETRVKLQFEKMFKKAK